ncbi:MAG: anthranilate phosphoribosyltransferase [candidate division Zixibacteria bacterium]
MNTKEIISKLIGGSDLSAEEAEQFMGEIADGILFPIQSAAFLTALAVKGETSDEIAGCAKAFRDRSLKVPHNQKIVFDCCGTGGDSSGSFNISTAVAFVVAACGIPTAKHGNRSVSSLCGSADVLEELGVKIGLKPKSAATCLDELGICFIFAPFYHPAMKHAAPIRKELGFRTVFNLLGPLLNPAETTHQIIGVPSMDIGRKLALTAYRLNNGKIRLLHNSEGLDELVLFGENWIISADENGVKEDRLDIGLVDGADSSSIKGGSANDNAAIIRSIFEGEKSLRRDTVVLNAAVGLVLVDAASDYKEGMKMAEETIDSGRVTRKLDKLIELSNKLV